MNLDKVDNLEAKDAKAAKKGFSFEKYVQQLQQMDINNIGIWPTSVKITVYLLILALIGALAYFALIKGVQEQIAGQEAQEQTLLNDFRKKDSELRNLQAYQLQVQQMEMQFNQQLEQLPKVTEIAGLVEDINMAGVSSGLEFKNIKLEPEVKQQIFIEQPIDITVQGNYHSMGGFVTAVAALPRIVTLHNFKIKSNQTKTTDVPKIEMNVKAKTYRYMNEGEIAEAAEAAEGAKQ